MNFLNTFFFDIYPYIAGAVFIISSYEPLLKTLEHIWH